MEEEKRIEMQLNIVTTGSFGMLTAATGAMFFILTDAEFCNSLPLKKFVPFMLTITALASICTLASVIGLLKPKKMKHERKLTVHDSNVMTFTMIQVSMMIGFFVLSVLEFL